MTLSDHLNDLVWEAHKTAVEKGWHEPAVSVPHALMMVVDEITEMLAEFRQEQVDLDKVYEEMADVFIRLFDFCGSQDMSGSKLAEAITYKMEKNKSRSYRHGNKPF